MIKPYLRVNNRFRTHLGVSSEENERFLRNLGTVLGRGYVLGLTTDMVTHASNLPGPFALHLAALNFENCDTLRLEKVAYEVISPGAMRRDGKSESRRRAHYAGRAAVAALFRSLGWQARVSPNPEYGYLQVVDETGSKIRGAFVNVSHTGNIAVAAIAPHPVGVDVELATRDASRVLPRVATPGELEKLRYLRSFPELAGIEPEIALWSAKEAFSKALGLGMKFGLQGFAIPFGPHLPFPVTTSLQGPFSLDRPAIRFLAFEGNVISICSEMSLLNAPPAMLPAGV